MLRQRINFYNAVTVAGGLAVAMLGGATISDGMTRFIAYDQMLEAQSIVTSFNQGGQEHTRRLPAPRRPLEENINSDKVVGGLVGGVIGLIIAAYAVRGLRMD